MSGCRFRLGDVFLDLGDVFLCLGDVFLRLVLSFGGGLSGELPYRLRSFWFRSRKAFQGFLRLDHPLWDKVSGFAERFSPRFRCMRVPLFQNLQ